jgi:hypothetical protein
MIIARNCQTASERFTVEIERIRTFMNFTQSVSKCLLSILVVQYHKPCDHLMLIRFPSHPSNLLRSLRLIREIKLNVYPCTLRPLHSVVPHTLAVLQIQRLQLASLLQYQCLDAYPRQPAVITGIQMCQTWTVLREQLHNSIVKERFAEV